MTKQEIKEALKNLVDEVQAGKDFDKVSLVLVELFYALTNKSEKDNSFPNRPKIT